MNRIIAHRGIHNNIIKENTYEAIFHALNNKDISGVEFDVRKARDNKLVIIHDSYINRTSNGIGKVEEMSLEELQKYNYGTKDLYQVIPTLDKILNIESKKIFLIEIKTDNNEKQIASLLINTIGKHPNKYIYVTSFNKKVLKYFYNTNIPIGPIIFNNNIRNKKYSFFVLNYYTYKKKTITKLQNNNIKVFIWSLNNYNVSNIDNVYLIKDVK